MATTIPYGEPPSARAGETWQWKKNLPDYPPATWTLSYSLHNASEYVSISASADGSDHLVDVAAATTAGYTAGRYDWVAQVTDGTEVFTVGTGSIHVLPQITAAYDGRSHARKMLEAIESMMEGRATAAQLAIVNASHNGRSLSHDPEALIKLHSRYSHMVHDEEEALRVSKGQSSSRLVQTRFVA